MVNKSKRLPTETSASKRSTIGSAGTQPVSAVTPAGNHDLSGLYSAVLRFRAANFDPKENSSVGARTMSRHEAVLIGATFDLRPADTVVASPREASVQFVTCNGVANRPTQTFGNDHLEDRHHHSKCKLAVAPDSIALVNFATSLALAHQWEGQGTVVLAFSDRPWLSGAEHHEAFKFAGKRKLPIVYVEESSWPETDAAVDNDSAMREVAAFAKNYGFPAIILDGNDVAAVWRVAQESIHRARLGTGPTLLDCKTTNVATEDSLVRLERYMRKQGASGDESRKSQQSYSFS